MDIECVVCDKADGRGAARASIRVASLGRRARPRVRARGSYRAIKGNQPAPLRSPSCYKNLKQRCRRQGATLILVYC